MKIKELKLNKNLLDIIVEKEEKEEIFSYFFTEKGIKPFFMCDKYFTDNYKGFNVNLITDLAIDFYNNKNKEDISKQLLNKYNETVKIKEETIEFINRIERIYKKNYKSLNINKKINKTFKSLPIPNEYIKQNKKTNDILEGDKEEEDKKYNDITKGYIMHNNINQFFQSKTKNQYNEDLIFNCFGFQEIVIDEDYTYFKLFINPVIDSKYLQDNEVFKFGKQHVERINTGGEVYNFNTVEFTLSHEDMMWKYSGNSLNCALTHFNEYFKEIVENIKNNENFYEIDYDNIF